MKAPDKIYVSNWIYNIWQYTIPDPDDETEVEYIRKDALIEWLSKCKNNPTITDLQKDNIQELIDKIDSI